MAYHCDEAGGRRRAFEEEPGSVSIYWVGCVDCAARPSSYAFFTSWFFHSMIAWLFSFARYLSNSSFRLPVKTRLSICSRACSNGIVSALDSDSTLKI